ncbi:hypothetical protein [Pseudomonas thivervalensis]|uniref:hypothetical protein n=1 Tax=Pseudomonas thivervalensis TaxID=86265 RepID=UPI00069D98E4|nr:hypothetical protein [Pseudomonas thivervalensis]
MPLSPPVIKKSARGFSDSTQIEVPSYLNVSKDDVVKLERLTPEGETAWESTKKVEDEGLSMTFDVPNDQLEKNFPSSTRIKTRLTVTRPSGNSTSVESTLNLEA